MDQPPVNRQQVPQPRVALFCVYCRAPAAAHGARMILASATKRTINITARQVLA